MNKEQLVKWRIDRNMNQKDLAELAGISPSYLSSLESGHYGITRKVDRKLSRAMALYDEQPMAVEEAPVLKTEQDQEWVDEQIRVLARLEEYQEAMRVAESLQSPGKVLQIKTSEPEDKEEPKHEGVPVDMVNSPSHYADRQFEVIDVMKDTMPRERFIGYCEGTVIKYLMRWDKKANPAEDLDKAKWYLNKLIETIKEEI